VAGKRSAPGTGAVSPAASMRARAGGGLACVKKGARGDRHSRLRPFPQEATDGMTAKRLRLCSPAGRSVCCCAPWPRWRGLRRPQSRLNGNAAAISAPSTGVDARPGFARCGSGLGQPAIDIARTRRASRPRRRFDHRGDKLRVVPDGHTLRVRFGSGSRLLVGGRPHCLRQFRFHIPGRDRVGAEELPTAMHFVRKSDAGRPVPLAVLFRLGAGSRALAALLPELALRGVPEARLPPTLLDPAASLPASHGDYACDVPLTAPPCTEGVRWIVTKQPPKLAAKQLGRLGRLLLSNAPPLRPLHARDRGGVALRRRCVAD
jgi:carbonic anhydrase